LQKSRKGLPFEWQTLELGSLFIDLLLVIPNAHLPFARSVNGDDDEEWYN